MTAPWFTNLMDPVVDRVRDRLLSAGCRWTPLSWELQRLGLGTAGGVVTGEFGLPTIGLGPGKESQAHSCDESVSVTSLLEAVFASAVLTHGLVGSPTAEWS